MTAEQSKAVVRRFWQAFEANDQAALNNVLAADLNAQTPAALGTQNRERHLQGIAAFNDAFSDRRFIIEEIVAEEYRVATRTTMQGVHTGDWQGHPATGKPFSATGLTIEHVQDGKIVERWFSFDTAQVMQQLGLVTPS